ncbi:MAG: UDP-N-acetylmuramate dehydrogenase [Clostridia bacterium]|nr:UDP-N-acetylmuramate dehydrogenase [Clostridia bacterium]
MDRPSFILENITLKNYTTFKAGGNALLFCEPSSVDELKVAVTYARSINTDVLVIGAGSNILVADNGYNGMVIRLGSKFSNIAVIDSSEDNETLYADAGTMLATLGLSCVKEGLTGAEFACGIPGSVGGAVFMNAGAYGGEMSQIVDSIDYLDEHLEINTISGSEAEFGYRHSIFTEHPEWIVVGCRVKLNRGVREESEALVNELKAKRIKSQPVDVPSAGSTFKRPSGYFAGRLIEDSNLKGFKLDDSGAQVSPKHAGFVVNNDGKASAEDILKLINYVSDKVYEDSGVRLEPEVRLIGFEA